jgi:signal transduction histidine kinase
MIAAARPFTRLSFSRQFMLLGVVVLLAGMLIIGNWLSRQIEGAVVDRAAAITALYVEGIVASKLKGLPRHPGRLSPDMQDDLDEVFGEGPLRRKLVQFKLWGSDGEILYSTDKSLVGKKFSVDGSLATAFSGQVEAKVSKLDKPENVHEREQWDKLIEIYVPVRAGANGEVTAVAEFYKSVDNLSRDIGDAQRRGWLVVAAANLGMFLLLLGLVRRASDTIHGQQETLRRQMDQLRSTLRENRQMHEELGEAGRRTTALNEQFLHRVAADLHDGPAQNLALALLRLDSIAESCCDCISADEANGQNFAKIRTAMQSAMTELRAISAGLSLPGIEPLTLAETARCAVHDFERKTGQKVVAQIDDKLGNATLAIKITLYRLIQESLNNGLKHADGIAQQVRVHNVNGQAQVEVIDQGPGFDAGKTPASGNLGLACMRERVKLVSGYFEIDSAPGRGTRILARLPLTLDVPAYA